MSSTLGNTTFYFRTDGAIFVQSLVTNSHLEMQTFQMSTVYMHTFSLISKYRAHALNLLLYPKLAFFKVLYAHLLSFDSNNVLTEANFFLIFFLQDIQASYIILSCSDPHDPRHTKGLLCPNWDIQSKKHLKPFLIFWTFALKHKYPLLNSGLYFCTAFFAMI